MKDCSSSLRMLQRIVTITRSLAYAEADTQTIARILDEADYLISIILHGEDEPGEFERVLKSLGDRFPMFANLAAEYPDPVAA